MSRLQVLEIIIKIITLDYFVIKQTIKRLMKKGSLSPRAKILDVGCGTGVLANMFNPQNYLGFDFDYDSVLRAKKAYPKYRFIEADVVKPSLGKKGFDLVLISGVLHHLDDSDLNSALKAIKLHLNKSGKLIIVEAIPPIFRWNVIGHILRNMDQGHNIRNLVNYVRLIKKHFKVIDSYQQIGGLVDYGVIFAGN